MNNSINNEHDLGYKSILSNKKNFVEFLRGFVNKQWVDLIKEEDLILIDKEFILEDFKEEEADIIYKVNLDGNEIIFYVLLELQSKVDFRMPIRLFMYMAEIWRDELKNTDEKIKKRKDYKLPAIVPMVLYNGKNNWTAARSFKEKISGGELFGDNIVDFKYLLFDVNRMEKDKLLEIANIISAVFLIDQHIEYEEIVTRLELIGRIIRKNATKEQLQVFRNWIVNIFKDRFRKNKDSNMARLLMEISEKEGEDMVSNLGRKIEEELKIREEKGREEGLEKTAQRLLLMGMDIRFVVEATGLDKDKIEKIKERLN
ncbi:MAG: Rpn family recombination-promoting nuclease/putative transposase [Anaeromicrobium sp.]|jgi:predicted transposase/invertase (TIGR01784 family)|uniref:Rpn family recombination-promoting nuclease/putative transposase n=1 Tax=Anaeromicrobium sp. TaxID=1929132 RepID=UPI0025F954C5|nr:Rpn family recombination-promoting nuclease/putative transposase [Anaeromicrobium sp.]MCT4595915.1 Rpn family recombination-promoting nuclease/putative transposase [Anaeromicrobium sp.]